MFARQLQRIVTARQTTHEMVVIIEIVFSLKYKLWLKKQLGLYEVSAL